MIDFSKLFVKIIGLPDTILATCLLESPLDMKNSNLGRRDLLGLYKSKRGRFAMIFVIWVWVNPCFLKNATTESGLSVASNFRNFDTDLAFSGVNPNDFTR